ncbi:hypothetical protein DIPPA_09720 [Diplonema papillatum]|nr:hypothetical protein DIPPA_09720 [Diplonema papillatum]|eukprot:gene8346-12866_t
MTRLYDKWAESRPWEKTLRKHPPGTVVSPSSHDMPKSYYQRARHEVVTRLQASAAAIQVQKPSTALIEKTNESDASLGNVRLIKEAVDALTTFVFDELEAAAKHMQNQAGQIDGLRAEVQDLKLSQSRSVAAHADHNTVSGNVEEAVKMSKQATRDSAKLKAVLKNLISESNDLALRVAHLEEEGRRRDQQSQKGLSENKMLLSELSKASSMIQSIKDEQLQMSSAAFEQKLKALRKLEQDDDSDATTEWQPAGEPAARDARRHTAKRKSEGQHRGKPEREPVPSRDPSGLQPFTADWEIKLREVAVAATRSQADVESIKQVLDARLGSIEHHMTDFHRKIEGVNNDNQQGRAATRHAIQTLAGILQVACPSL